MMITNSTIANGGMMINVGTDYIHMSDGDNSFCTNLFGSTKSYKTCRLRKIISLLINIKIISTNRNKLIF